MCCRLAPLLFVTLSSVSHQDIVVLSIELVSAGGCACSTNRGETLSTLMFAQRCMRIETAPVINEHVDYKDLCAKLQARARHLPQAPRLPIGVRRRGGHSVGRPSLPDNT